MYALLLQAAADSSAYKLGYKIGSWLPFVLLALLLTVMILSIRKRRSK